jgi:thiol-disulfide isomerase/thioredoxin
MQKLPFVALAIMVTLGCGSGTSATEQQAGGTPEASVATESPRTGTPAIETQAAPSSLDEIDQAEGRARAAASKPAVDTSQLKAAPDWQMPGLNGQIVSSAEYDGKVMLVDFWATWCGPCKRSIPHLIELQEEYKDKGVAIIGVSLDQAGPKKVIPFVEHYKINYPVVMGTQKAWSDFGGIRGVPTAFIISQDGKIYRKIVGLVPKEKYEQDIKALLGIS